MFWQAYPKVKSSCGNYTKDAVVDADLSYRVRIRTETCRVWEELSSNAHAKAAAAAWALNNGRTSTHRPTPNGPAGGVVRVDWVWRGAKRPAADPRLFHNKSKVYQPFFITVTKWKNYLFRRWRETGGEVFLRVLPEMCLKRVENERVVEKGRPKDRETRQWGVGIQRRRLSIFLFDDDYECIFFSFIPSAIEGCWRARSTWKSFIQGSEVPTVVFYYWKRRRCTIAL